MHFVSAKASEICRQPNTLYPKKVLAKAVAECFLGETYRVYVEDAIAQQHEETGRTARQAQDADLRAQEMAELEAAMHAGNRYLRTIKPSKGMT